MSNTSFADDFHWTLRSQSHIRSQSQTSVDETFVRHERTESWKAAETAFIVCDVWDYHHCLNAVNRLNEFGPRLNEVLTKARQQGALIIHAPSDCMAAYEGHPARIRAEKTPAASNVPADIKSWCSLIPSEESGLYPIDQSDGGEDDDPEEHARWAESLRAMGRNPGMPWKSQNAMISIDAQKDFISDRGDEVWNILEAHGIRNVVLTGVHTNMCVLGRPFGLRQMVRGGRNVVLMRDMTDCMYNPKRWPYVDHFTGNDLVVSHIERFVCPTVTSDQLLGGKPFRFSKDMRAESDISEIKFPELTPELLTQQWSSLTIPVSWAYVTPSIDVEQLKDQWYRCTLRISSGWIKDQFLLSANTDAMSVRAWLNGTELHQLTAEEAEATRAAGPGKAVFVIPRKSVLADDANLLVIHCELLNPDLLSLDPPAVHNGMRSIPLRGRWQVRLGTDDAWSNIPLPARFGIGSDVVFNVR